MSLLDRIWNTSLDLWYRNPPAELKIDGFEFSVVRKNGVLLTSHVKGDTLAEAKPASANFYFEASVRPTGENAEYPEREKPSIFCFTYGVHGNSSQGMVGNIGYIPHDYKFLKFELQEEFCQSGQNMGAHLPDHHSVYLKAHFRNNFGRHANMGFSSWSRKSEKSMLDEYRGAPMMCW